MSTIERIYNIAESKGIRTSFILKNIGKNEAYFRQVKTGRASIPQNVLAEIADILDTSVEYLNGETDDPMRPDEVEYEALPKMDERKKALLALFDALSEEGKEKLFHSAVDLMRK